jgi:hypothetical protein
MNPVHEDELRFIGVHLRERGSKLVADGQGAARQGAARQGAGRGGAGRAS